MKIRTAKSIPAAAIGTLALLIAVHASVGEARERASRERPAAGESRAARADGAQRARPAAGGNWTRTSERQRTDSGFERHDRWQNADGKTASRDLTVTRTDNGYSRDSTITNPQGQTATRSVDVARDREAGTLTRNAEWTRFDGKSGNSQSVTTRTEDGFSRQTSGTLASGEDFSRSVVKQCDKAAKSCSTTVSNNGGAGGG